jgi:hypothetical protein
LNLHHRMANSRSLNRNHPKRNGHFSQSIGDPLLSNKTYENPVLDCQKAR